MTIAKQRKPAAADSAPDDTQDDPLLRTCRVAKMLDLDEGTLSNWRTLYGQSRLPVIKLNQREVRYRRSAVLAFIAERESSTPERMGRQFAENGQCSTPEPSDRPAPRQRRSASIEDDTPRPESP